MNIKNYIDEQVLYIATKYDQKLHRTEKEYILGLLNNKSPEEMLEYLQKEYNIDHSYMIKTLDELKMKVAKKDGLTTLEEQRLQPDLLDINPIDKFTDEEQEYANKVINRYIDDLTDISNQEDIEAYLSTKIKNYDKNIEQFKPYFHNGMVYSMQNLATYNSMLYNVNLTRTAWNQAYKDSFVLNNDKFIINSHPFACEHCLQHQNKVYTRKELENIIETSVEEGATEILHPNCKCTLSLYWDSSQKEQNLTTPKDYELDQREKAITRQLSKLKTEKDLYKEVGNNKKAQKKQEQIKRLQQERKDIQQQMENIRKRYYNFKK
jgi:hypothetical protein